MSGQNPLDNHKKAPGSSIFSLPVLPPPPPAPSSLTSSPSTPRLTRAADIQKVVAFLRNKADLKTRTGALAGKRHDYFRGPPPCHPSSSQESGNRTDARIKSNCSGWSRAARRREGSAVSRDRSGRSEGEELVMQGLHRGLKRE